MCETEEDIQDPRPCTLGTRARSALELLNADYYNSWLTLNHLEA